MPFEFAILDFIQQYMRTEFLDKSMIFITNLGAAGFIWILLALMLLLHPKMRQIGVVLLIALIFDFIFCNILMKPLIARVRPYDVNRVVQLLVPKLGDHSFPSGHTAAAFTVTTALYLTRQKVLWKTAFVLSILMAFSRLYLYVHYPTDIIGGVIVGIFCGFLGYQVAKKILKREKRDKNEQIGKK